MKSINNLNLNIMEWYLKVVRNYAVFTGRARRTEYWMFVLFNILFAALASVLDWILGSWNMVSGLYGLAMLIPSIAVAVRRLHDINKTGFFLLIGLIPVIGFIWLLILFLKEGDMGDNQYGTDPKL